MKSNPRSWKAGGACDDVNPAITVELSIQGEDFSRQICHLYDIFEDFVEGQTGGAPAPQTKSPSPKSPKSLTGSPVSHSMRPQPIDKDNILSEVTMRTYSPPITKREKRNYQRIQKKNTRRSVPTLTSTDMYSSNPLLDTISVLASDRFESDDEYNELTMCKKVPCDRKLTEEYGGYAGSNSIDSGYKSSCPTPDLSDSQCYGDRVGMLLGNKVAVDSVAQEGSHTLGRPVKKKKKRNDSGFYDINLDHLMYLRQSLISAMDSSSSSQGVSKPGQKPGKIDADEPATAVKTTAATTMTTGDRTRKLSSQSLCDSQRLKFTSLSGSKSKLNTNCSSSEVRSQNPATLNEQDVDKLLYDQAEYYDLESVEEFPCSYVNSTESSSQPKRISRLATVKKLKAREPKVSKVEKPIPETNVADDVKLQQTALETGPKRKFTEVAKCMLEIIDDFQKLKLKSPARTDTSQISLQTPRSDRLRRSANQYIDDPLSRGKSSASRTSEPSTYRPASEYHVYEEILYDSMTSYPGRHREVPPPLPARPNGLKKGATGTNSGQSHEPKQRRNLYSIFTEKSDRRYISQSLERERVDDGIDEYGFKTNSSAV